MSDDKASTETAPESKDDTSRVETLEAELDTARKQVALIRQAHTEAAAEFEKTKARLRRNHESVRGRGETGASAAVAAPE